MVYQGWKLFGTKLDSGSSHSLEESVSDWPSLQWCSCTHRTSPIAGWWGHLTYCWRFWIQGCPSRLVTTQCYLTCYLPIVGGGEEIGSYLSQGYLHVSECNEHDWNSNPALRIFNPSLYPWLHRASKLKY